MEALYTIKSENGVKCFLCPHNCIIKEGFTGKCKVRKNIGGKLIALSWGRISSIHMDPIEKKPLYHFYPGKSILSIGSVGCNMRCKCCQNWGISQLSTDDFGFDSLILPEQIIKTAIDNDNNIGIAFTYNEPSIWYEYVLDVAMLSGKRKLKNVMVTNGFISEKPLTEILKYIDAFNVDLKGFTNDFYQQFTGSTLLPVLNTLKMIRNSGKHLEITNLVIPGQNDDPIVFGEMIRWIVKELGRKTVLHLSRYFPSYKMETGPTSSYLMEELLEIAQQELPFVYSGNINLSGFSDTKCDICHNTVIKRIGYTTSITGLSEDGRCINCSNQIIFT